MALKKELNGGFQHGMHAAYLHRRGFAVIARADRRGITDEIS
ncbi:hypothetical protein FHS77_001905 [Paenochrobactrum gallinarii]|uniref:Uncharacterized protein n=1 Tax=Paenochrobactrum gallinarii TaxID=643673 RepID=A0A841M715_9HYPH|nr:hypothetical protein [Paenochrobactrum gallinarii]MBB6261354.1 hypothetical protein [Paenochrobactrum gallinarii]